VGLVITIWFERHGEIISSQIVALSMCAMLGPIGAGFQTHGFRQKWFWVALAISSAIHTILLWKLQSKLPLPGVLIAIFIGSLEAVVLAVVSIKVRQLLIGDQSRI
jgi:hypothetical protein